MTAFLLGLRASEVTDRVVRDLDDNGRLLWIVFGKTRRARRTLEVPALLRPYLLALAKGRAPDAQLNSRTISRHSGKKRDRYWLAHHVERLCTDAGVPVVCTQSLRGLHASVATEAGATPMWPLPSGAQRRPDGRRCGSRLVANHAQRWIRSHLADHSPRSRAPSRVAVDVVRVGDRRRAVAERGELRTTWQIPRRRW